MKITTTCIGAYPKPNYLKLPDWFNNPDGPDAENPTQGWQAAIEAVGEDIILKATQEVIQDQIDCGIDVPTDGEVKRENYIHYHCRHLNGFSFDNLTRKELRNGAYAAYLPTVVGPVSAKTSFLTTDWKSAQRFTDKPLKITMPGPMTITDTNANEHYDSPAKLGADLADALNQEVRELADAGCVHIQIDEPLFARKPDAALEYGFENLERAFYKCPKHVVRTVHMCCGYPDRLDRDDYPKADQDAYQQIADAINDSCIDAVSIEDAHRHNDLSLIDKLHKTKVIFGIVAIAKSEIEEVEALVEHLRQVLEHIDRDRLIAAPDCGLGLLGRELAMKKLKNLCQAATAV